jgi:phage terminase small subunit
MTPKQERFVAEYLIDLNATAAAKRAGYSDKTARAIGHENLTKPDIAAAVAEGKARQLDSMEVTAERVLRELARLAFSDIRGVFDENGGLLKPHELSDDVARMIASIEVTKERSYKKGDDETVIEYVSRVRTVDKLGALNTLAKHLKLLTDRVEHSADVTLFELLTGEKPE